MCGLSSAEFRGTVTAWSLLATLWLTEADRGLQGHARWKKPSPVFLDEQVTVSQCPEEQPSLSLAGVCARGLGRGCCLESRTAVLAVPVLPKVCFKLFQAVLLLCLPAVTFPARLAPAWQEVSTLHRSAPSAGTSLDFKGGCEEDEGSAFTRSQAAKSRGSGGKLQQERFHLGIRKDFLIGRTIML